MSHYILNLVSTILEANNFSFNLLLETATLDYLNCFKTIMTEDSFELPEGITFFTLQFFYRNKTSTIFIIRIILQIINVPRF